MVADMHVLLESSWPWLIAGLLLEGVLAVVFFNTGQAKILLAMLVVAIMTLGGMLVERWIVTDREQVANTLDEARRALEANDLDHLLSLMGPEAASLRERVQHVLPRYTITAARVAGLSIDVTTATQPKMARAEFTGRVTGRDQSGQVPYDTYVGRFTIRFRQEGDRWIMVGYQETETGR